MRSYRETLSVRRDVSRGTPAQFRWRRRVWSVNVILRQWVETGAWWNSPAVMALRGTSHGSVPDNLSPLDLIHQTEVFVVEAVCAYSGNIGVFTLSHNTETGEWVMRGVAD